MPGLITIFTDILNYLVHFTGDSMCVILLGMTGVGKSATGNSIVNVDPHFSGQRPFQSVSNAKSVTGQSVATTGNVLGQTITIVDTPGFKDTNLTIDEICKEILAGLLLVAPGPHIILICVKISSRMTPEVTDALEDIRSVLGNKFEAYTIIVFTGRDSLEFDEIPMKKFLDDMEPNYKKLLQRCGNRYVAFNNYLIQTDPSKNNEQVATLMQEMQQLMSNLNGERYSDKYFTVPRLERVKNLRDAHKGTLVPDVLSNQISSLSAENLNVLLKTEEGKKLVKEVKVEIITALAVQKGFSCNCCVIL